MHNLRFVLFRGAMLLASLSAILLIQKVTTSQSIIPSTPSSKATNLGPTNSSSRSGKKESRRSRTGPAMANGGSPIPNLAKEPTLYVVGSFAKLGIGDPPFAMAGPVRDRRDSFFPERLEEFVGPRFVAFDEGVDGIMDCEVVTF